MFDSETYRNLAVIVNAAKKRISKKAIGAFLVAAKDLIALVANGITSGVPIDDWDVDSKTAPFWQKLEESGNRFFDIIDEEYPEGIKAELTGAQ